MNLVTLHLKEGTTVILVLEDVLLEFGGEAWELDLQLLEARLSQASK